MLPGKVGEEGDGTQPSSSPECCIRKVRWSTEPEHSITQLYYLTLVVNYSCLTCTEHVTWDWQVTWFAQRQCINTTITIALSEINSMWVCYTCLRITRWLEDLTFHFHSVALLYCTAGSRVFNPSLVMRRFIGSKNSASDSVSSTFSTAAEVLNCCVTLTLIESFNKILLKNIAYLLTVLNFIF